MNLSIIGLVLIILAWIAELFKMGELKQIRPCFIALYILGVVFLVIDGFSSNLTTLAILNLITGVIALIVLIKAVKK
ncbi:MAG: hypothetical protein V1824_04410 [archaeon]